MKSICGIDKTPDIRVQGHLKTTFPYVLNHLKYIIGELLRNSIQAVAERYERIPGKPPPIDVLICEAPQHVTMRVSDQGGGIPREILPSVWSFSKGTNSKTRLENFSRVPSMAATMQELTIPRKRRDADKMTFRDNSLDSLSSRPSNLRLGMGLPMSRVYAEYWAGRLELHSLGNGVDIFLQISKLGNQNEQVATRAAVNAV